MSHKEKKEKKEKKHKSNKHDKYGSDAVPAGGGGSVAGGDGYEDSRYDTYSVGPGDGIKTGAGNDPWNRGRPDWDIESSYAPSARGGDRGGDRGYDKYGSSGGGGYDSQSEYDSKPPPSSLGRSSRDYDGGYKSSGRSRSEYDREYESGGGGWRDGGSGYDKYRERDRDYGSTTASSRGGGSGRDMSTPMPTDFDSGTESRDRDRWSSGGDYDRRDSKDGKGGKGGYSADNHPAIKNATQVPGLGFAATNLNPMADPTQREKIQNTMQMMTMVS